MSIPKSLQITFFLYIMPIVGLDSLRRKDNHDDDDNDGNEYFAGGIGSQGGGR